MSQGYEIAGTDDAAAALAAGGAFLAREPVLHNLVLSLLHARAASGEPGRYWTVTAAGGVVGTVFQSPLDFVATLTPMAADAVDAAVAAIVAEGVRLPGVNAEAATAARFAGAWLEHADASAVPVSAMRLYEAQAIDVPGSVPGRLRPAGEADRPLLARWLHDFQLEIGEERITDPAAAVERLVATGHLFAWDDDGVVSMAATSPPIEGASRIYAVFTPPARRGRGYAAACVAQVSEAILAAGRRALLYADLGNPVSNRIYRRIGYRAVAECLRYRFD